MADIIVQPKVLNADGTTYDNLIMQQALNATNDGNGNNISNTYTKGLELTLKSVTTRMLIATSSSYMDLFENSPTSFSFNLYYVNEIQSNSFSLLGGDFTKSRNVTSELIANVTILYLMVPGPSPSYIDIMQQRTSGALFARAIATSEIVTLDDVNYKKYIFLDSYSFDNLASFKIHFSAETRLAL